MTTAGPVVVVGPGSVGCGVVAAALQRGRQPYVLVARTEESAARLRGGPAQVRTASRSGSDTLTLRPDSVVTIDDPAHRRVVGRARLVVVAVAAGQAATIAAPLARALSQRATPVPVLVCDNREGAAAALRSLVAEHDLTEGPPHAFAGVLVDRIVNRTRQPGDGLTFSCEATGALYADRQALGGVVPDLPGLVGVDRFRSHLTRKRFVFSAGHAATAFLGGVAGHRTLPEALADDHVQLLVRAAMREGQAGIAAACGEAFAGGESDVDACIARFRNPDLADPIIRVGRDPLRKLGRDERICGPARLAQAAGTGTGALAVVAAAALVWGAVRDPHLCVRLERAGVRHLVAGLAGLGVHDPFVDQVVAAHRELAAGGAAMSAYARLGGDVLVARGGRR